MDDYQKLNDFSLIQGEYKIININTVSRNGETRSIVNFTPKLDVYIYGDRSEPLFSISGVKADNYSCSFTIPSSETIRWFGKLEYVISLDYSNGNSLKGIGYIVIV